MVSVAPFAKTELPHFKNSPILLRAEGLSKAFGGEVVLDGVNLELHQGEVVLLRGENGSGKTTLLNILTGNLEPDAGVIIFLADATRRSYRFPRRSWQELNPFDHFTPEFVSREGIGRTWQDVRLFGSQSLRDNIAVAAPAHPGENPLTVLFWPHRATAREAEINLTADVMLDRLGLAGCEDSSADRISLGQSKRVAIARAVAAGAKILFLDEPLAGLDGQGIDDVLTLLESLVTDHDVTLVMVEHVLNQPHLHGIITTDWLLESGNLTRNGSISPIADNRQWIHEIGHRPSWFAILAGEDAELVDEPLPRGAVLTRIRRSDVFHPSSKPVLEIRSLVVNRGPRTVIGLDDHGDSTGFSFSLYEGEIVILQAPNGWGKSTLFAAITGLVPINQGEIHLNATTISGPFPWERVRHGLRALPSNHHLFPSLKVKELLELSRTPGAMTNLGPLAEKACGSLSGGQKQRVALAALATDVGIRTLLLLDEPFSMLDSKAITAEASRLSNVRQKAVLICCPHSFAS